MKKLRYQYTKNGEFINKDIKAVKEESKETIR